MAGGLSVDNSYVGVLRRRRDLISAVLLAAAVSTAVLDDGGFNPGPREIFGGLAAAALASAVYSDRCAALAAARRPVAVVLWLLAGLGAISAIWTKGLVGDSLRWGLVTAGYGAMYVATVVLAERHRRTPAAVAIGICALATISALVGLVAVASSDPLFADYVRGTWRPGGTVEYSPALSLLVVSALPIALLGMCRRSPRVTVPATLAGTICAAALVLGRSRAEIALAVVVALAAIAIPERTVRASRRRAAGAVATLLVAGVGARLVMGHAVSLRATPHTARALVELALVCLVPAALWVTAATRSWSGLRMGSRTRRLAAVAVGVVLASSLAGGLTLAAAAHPPRYVAHNASAGFWHGRLTLWGKTIQTAEDRPLIGGGADGFLAASILYQRSSPIRFAHDLPLELAAELGIAGFLLALGLYVTSARELWRARTSATAWILVPAAAAFLVANLIDWPWHLAGCGAVWAAALGAISARSPDRFLSGLAPNTHVY
jgi:O-antigen ligase